MNKNRRKELYAIANKLLVLKSDNNNYIEAEINSIKNELDMILYDEESYMNNMPENLQSGYRYEVAENACDHIECAIDDLNDGDVDSAIDNIYSATV